MFKPPWLKSMVFGSIREVFREERKGQFLELRAENHLDRQSVVGFPPEGSYSSPFGLKPSFWAVPGRFSEEGKKSVFGTAG